MPSSISVVIPVYNSAAYLRSCLNHLFRSTVQPLECIVVDDGSTDTSRDAARQAGVKILSTGGRRGPAYARNLGARAARGNILFFMDADVCVHAGTLERIGVDFSEDASLDALIGSYDHSPEAKDFLSQYRNLMHCYVHQNARSQACTFWSGCGAIRREVFIEFSGFDESYGRPAIEDIELGFRLSRAGRKILLDRGLLVKHLKRWTFWNLVKTDVLDRGIPWTELMLRDRKMPNDLNLHLSQRISVALAFLMVLSATVLAIHYKGYFLTPLFALLFFLLGTYWVDTASKPGGKGATIALTAVLGAIVALAWVSHMLAMIPPLVFGYLLLFLRHRYVYKDEGKRRMTGAAYGVYLLFTVLFIFTYLPKHLFVFLFFFVLALTAAINLHFYLFLAKRWGRLYALGAVPFHLLYHLYNGISFIAGTVRFGWRTLAARRAGIEPARASSE